MNTDQIRCPRCGKENKPGTKFCKYCGKRIYSKSLINLWEVILLIAVFGMILWIVIPNIYRLPPKQNEAKQNLKAIYSAYQQYHSDHHTYPSLPSIQIGNTIVNCLEIADWKPAGTIRYNYNCMSIEAFSPATNDSPCPPGIVTTATKDSFTIAACGNVDNDTTVDVWTINDSKKLKNVIDDVRK